AAEIRIQDGFVKDDFAQQCEPFQRPYKFLWTGRVPEVGQRTETQITTAEGAWLRLSGIVTEIGEEPTFDQWVTTSSLAPQTVCECSIDPYANARPETKITFPPGRQCPAPDCIMCKLRPGLFGALQGQKITSFAYLNGDFAHRAGGTAFDKDGGIYKIVYKLDDSKEYIWIVEAIYDCTDCPTAELPQPFKDWELGQQNGGVAPFHWPELDRKIWKVFQETKMQRELTEDLEKYEKAMETAQSEEEEDEAEGMRVFGGPVPPKSPLLLFAFEQYPAVLEATMLQEKKNQDDAMKGLPPHLDFEKGPDGVFIVKDPFERITPEFKGILTDAYQAFQHLKPEERKKWYIKHEEDKERYQKEKDEFGGDY
ncbi:MAG: hypothetical protein SGARI_001504, partial [Bacillariaceae sp.]